MNHRDIAFINSLKNVSGIYLIENVNGKKYVGSSKDIKTRMRSGILTLGTRLNLTMNYIYLHEIKFSVLEYCDQDLLRKKEYEWIKELDSFYPNGYNMLSPIATDEKHSYLINEVENYVDPDIQQEIERINKGYIEYLRKFFVTCWQRQYKPLCQRIDVFSNPILELNKGVDTDFKLVNF